MNNGKCPQCGYCSHCGRSNSPLMKPLNPLMNQGNPFVQYDSNTVFGMGTSPKSQAPDGFKFIGYTESSKHLQDEINRVNEKAKAKPDTVPEWLEELMERLTRLEELSEEDY